MDTDVGRLVFVLHAHLPWVRHAGHGEHAQERWLFDAITDTYLPLIDRLFALRADHVPTRLTLAVSPTLLGMLADPRLQARYVRHLERLILFTDEEIRRLRHEPAWQRVAVGYHHTFRAARREFCDRHHGYLVAALRDLARAGVVELATSAASHALLPMHTHEAGGARAQIEIGMEEFHRHFGWAPSGFWLPECGFSPEIDAELASAGVRWVVLEGHGLALAHPSPTLGLRAPIVTPSGVAAFGRARALARLAWSLDDGYPGDGDYRDFDSDVALELPRDRVARLLPESGERVATGIKYHRYAAPGAEREPYDAERAMAKAGAHARNFVERAGAWLGAGRPADRPAALVAAYDAELFGHWWHEGLAWLEHVVRGIAYDRDDVALATPAEVLEESPVLQCAEPASSTWGEGGYFAPWVSGENDWLRTPLYEAARRMHALATRHPHATGTLLRALNQAGRELLLAQASDWPLMMARATSAEYAIARARRHLDDFEAIADAIEHDRIDVDALASIEARDGAFPALDYRTFGPRPEAPPKRNGADRIPRSAP